MLIKNESCGYLIYAMQERKGRRGMRIVGCHYVSMVDLLKLDLQWPLHRAGIYSIALLRQARA